MNQKTATLAVLFLIVFAAFIAPLETNAQGTMGVTILQVTPASQSASAGTIGNVQGTIYTLNGTYQVIIGKTIVATGKSDGYFVHRNFTVPELPSATYALILCDVDINVNASNKFSIERGYQISAFPTIIQEGAGVSITATVTGSQLGTNYRAEISVTNPKGDVYTSIVSLGTPNVDGTTSASASFPADFTGGLTDYCGTYELAFNDSLAKGQFTVNILDSTAYHRGETVNIKAVGYQANQGATLTVTRGSTIIDTKTVNADENGVITTTWIVPSNAPIGELTLKIFTTDGSQKSPVDQQTFAIAGYNVQVQVTNLSDRGVPDLSVKATDAQTETYQTSIADSSGVASFKLDKGGYDLTAYLDEVVVGSTNITVTGDGTFTLRCQLGDMKITVKTFDGTPMSFVDLSIKYQYQSGSISRSGNLTGETDPTGSFIIASTVAGATYTIEASVYNRVFNGLNNTATSLYDQSTTNVVIICPSENVVFSVTGHDNQAIPSARIELVELSNGLFYYATTDISGNAQTTATFGKYRVRIYMDNALISQENIQVFTNTHKQIRCTLYGIQLQVSVVDFFGSPISGTTVTLNGPAKAVSYTRSNGVATFNNIIGGEMQIIAQAQGTPEASQAINVDVNEPTTVQIKLAKYISLGGVLMQASSLITVLVILVIAALFLAVEVVRRRRKAIRATRV